MSHNYIACYFVEAVALLAIYVIRKGTDDDYICMRCCIPCIIVYGLWFNVVSLIQKGVLVTSLWFRRGDQWRVRVRKGTIGEWTNSVTYLWRLNRYHMHIELRSWCIAYILALRSSYYCNLCIAMNYIHVIGDCLNYTLIYYLCIDNSIECILTPDYVVCGVMYSRDTNTRVEEH